MELLSASLVDWSRLQFAMTAMFHWLFVPLTLGLGVIMAIMETIYVKTGDERWKKTTKFWMTLFGINFAIGIATGIIMEFQFGTNWSNYSWFVGDIFGAPLAIEAIAAFFLEATFITVMFFGWSRVSKGTHLAATWLTAAGATLSALWILVANAWMQYPVGMEFNPDTARNEMIDFWAVALSPVAITKFLHAVISSWILGSVFVIGVAAWFLLKKRNVEFAKQSIKVGAIFGLISSVLTLITGDTSGYHVAQYQPMKLAAMEGLYEGRNGTGLIIFGVPNPAKKSYNDNEEGVLYRIELPRALSYLGYRDLDAFVPGIKDIIDGGYDVVEGKALSFEEKKEKGKAAREALSKYQAASANGDNATMADNKAILKENYPYFGYAYLNGPEELIPNIPLTFWSFRIMVGLGGYFIILFVAMLYFGWRKTLDRKKWLLWLSLFSIPLAYVASQAGWIVAEVGRYPWAIQDVLPLQAAVSALSASSVMITFFLFFALFLALFIAEIRIMLNQVKKGPDSH